MKERIERFLESLINSTMNPIELKEIYQAMGNSPLGCESVTCTNKMINAVKKYHYINFEQKKDPEPAIQEVEAVIIPARKYVLKEGNHAIAPGGPADHNNDNTSDADIEYYLRHYPHIRNLLINGY